jgi:hypothetical protein
VISEDNNPVGILTLLMKEEARRVAARGEFDVQSGEPFLLKSVTWMFANGREMS